MRIVVVHNPAAGPDEVDVGPLVASLERAGHQTRLETKSPESIRHALDFAPEVVIAAGGDGTVAAVARELVGSRIPILPIPFGTANNIATSLGAVRDVLRVIATGRARPFDAGVCTNGDAEWLFFEGAGVGPFPEVIDKLDGVQSDRSRKEQLEHASHVLTGVAAAAPAYSCRLDLDGDALDGSFVMIEIMNIPLMGPGLRLADAADPGDGMLDVIVVRESQRAELVAFLAERASRPDTPAPFEARRTRQARLRTTGPTPLHLDDRAMTGAPLLDVTFTVRPHAVWFLVERPDQTLPAAG